MQCRSVHRVSSAQSTTRLGVDLGTLSVAAAITITDGADSDCKAVDLGPLASSAVAVVDGSFVFGVPAETVIAGQPDHGTHELKRRFGDKTPLILDGHPHDADALTTELLRAVTAKADVDPSTTALTLTHPANWREYKVDLLRNVATSAGFTDVELISEPVAAARQLVDSGVIAVGDTVAVYSFGATFEASIVALTASGAQIVGTPQDLERLGGIDFDQVVFGHVVQTLGGAVQQLDRSDPAVHAAIAGLRAQCTLVKERLSTDGEATVAVALPGLATEVRITRDEFETALRPRLTETLNALDRALASGGTKPSELRGIVLTGATSRIPLVAEMIAGHLGRPILNNGDAQLIVALGAALGPMRPTNPPVPVDASSIPTPISSPIITKETPMSDQPSSTPAASADAPAAAPAASTDAGGRSTPPPPAPPTRGAPSKAAKIAGGVAAAAAVVAGVAVFGDDAVDAVFGDDGDDIAQAAGLETHQPQRNEREGDGGNQSMDAFDAAPAVAAPAAAAPVQGPLGTPLAAQMASVQESAVHQQGASFAPAAHSQPVQQDSPQHQTQPQPQAQPAPAPQQDVPMASAAAGPTENADFEAARATLLDRLDNFQAPPGTSEQDAAALKQDLVDAIERFQPAAGQSTQEALAALRDDYDQRVQDFTQDQKIDALVREAQRDNAADATAATGTTGAAADPAAGSAPVPPPDAADVSPAAADDTDTTPATDTTPTTDPAAATGDPNVSPVDPNAATADPATAEPAGDALASSDMANARFSEVAAADLSETIDTAAVATAAVATAGDAGALDDGEGKAGGDAAGADMRDEQETIADGGTASSRGEEIDGGSPKGGDAAETVLDARGGEAQRFDQPASGGADERSGIEDQVSDLGRDAGHEVEADRPDADANAAGGAHSDDGNDSIRSDEQSIDTPNLTIDVGSHVLVDDFDSLTAEPVGASSVVDAGPPLATEPVTVIDVRASLPESDGPRPVMIVDDVVGDSTYTDVVQAASADVAAVPLALGDVDVSVSAAVTVDLSASASASLGDGGDGGDGDGDSGGTNGGDGTDGPAPFDIVVTIDTVDATALSLAPVDDDSGDDDSVDFATDIASDITPNTPTDLNFGP